MSMEKKEANGIWVGIFGLAAAIIRPLTTLKLLPFNLVPIGGLALFSGARWPSRLAYLVPLGVMVVTDLVLTAIKGEMYSPLHLSQAFVYGSFLVYVFLGRSLAQTRNPLRIGAVTLLGSVQFFLITNFGAWLVHPQQTGLLECLEQGLPFFGFTLLGDFLFTAIFFVVHGVAVQASEPEPATLEAAVE